ncbi:solute carrier family 66 member 2 isoform X2 [Mastacembelus armatus]|uniref:solute carrier family 66 member 2 isoform X2 n=1 Tax=Mastacembelus armatus TaxID=205130 RepID=UPI000E45A872|nr:solute carrier family 66 member 2-like isoform X2 [Mastacembelus armatus]
MDAEMVLQEDDMESSWTLLSWVASCLMVFGGALPYLPQYQEIQSSGNTKGFSTRVCLVLLIANILRIFFWIGKQFELTLLLQSVVMILTMFAMLHLCCTVQNTNRVSTKQHRLSDLDFQYFWKWSAFEDYLFSSFGFTVLCAVVTLLLLDSAVFVEMLGSLAVMFEAMLGLPQLLQNFHNRSTKGMRNEISSIKSGQQEGKTPLATSVQTSVAAPSHLRTWAYSVALKVPA